MQIEVTNLSPTMIPKLEELLYRLILGATELGIGLDSITLGLHELGRPDAEKAKCDASRLSEN